MLLQRVRKLNSKNQTRNGEIVYWMSRDQRVDDNWAFIYAYDLAQSSQRKLTIIFTLTERFLNATTIHYDFMLNGLHDVIQRAEKLHVSFILLTGDPVEALSNYVEKQQVSTLICDFSPLRIGRHWRTQIASSIDIPVFEVDAHNIVPIWVTSDKLEYGAYTIRSKIHKQLKLYLDPYPELHPLKQEFVIKTTGIRFSHVHKTGQQAARRAVIQYITNKLALYENFKNDPITNVQSNLSAFLHFGHVSSQWITNEIKKSNIQFSTETFLEELIIRKELADNFCFYNPKYDSFEGFPKWAQQTLIKHSTDPREYTYSFEEFRNAETHDTLWNAAQKQMVESGRMHGYLRMYWAKKILEWTADPHEAIIIANTLNDTFEFDGRDPNGYAGTAWSIGGVHDRPWFERPIFGTVRYMNASGCAKKFNVEKYIQLWNK